MKRKKPIKKRLNIRQWTKYVYWLFVVVLLVTAIFTRYIHLKSIQKNDSTFYNLPAGTDMLTYDNQAQEILKGRHPAPYYYGPLYSYFLSLAYLIFGHNLYIIRFIQMIFGVFTCLFIFLIAKKVFGKGVAIVSLALSVFYDMFIVHEGLILLEALATFLNTLFIFFLLKSEETRQLKYIFLSGILLALSSLCRTSILLFLPFVFIWMLVFFKRRAFSYFFIFSLTTFIFISPATIMNYLSSKKFTLVTTNGPVLLWIGNNECADGTYLTYPLPEKLQKRLSEIGDRAYIEDVIRFAKEKPKLFLNLLLKKFLLFWGRFEIANNMNYEDIKKASYIIRLPFFIGFGFIAPLSLFGMILSLKNKRCLLLFLFIFSFILSIIAIHVLGRYRISFIPAIIPFASCTLFWLYEKIRKMEYKRILLSIPLLSLCFFIIWQEDARIFYFKLKNPAGIHKDGVITDSKCILSQRNAIVLHNGEEAKKEFMIIEDISLYKEAKLSFDYMAYGEGKLIIDINEGVYSIQANIQPTQGMSFNLYNIPLPIKFLKKGKNSFVFKVEGDWVFVLPYDPIYSFKRSHQFIDGKFKKINGEFIISLNLINA
ncbi:MAG: glycosyltransferase family 39 protein [bacterium]